MRYGEMTAFEERPHSPYYGAADATMLYVVLLDEYERWTGDRKLVRDLEQQARAALAWIDDYADLMGNGYVSYQRRNEDTGLENQCWKDSWDSISYRNGEIPGFPRATCELQGYAYDAKVRWGPARPAGVEGPGLSRTSSSTRLRTSSAGSTVTSGSKTANTSRWLSTTKENRSMRSLRTTATCSGAASSTRRRRRLSRGNLMGPGSSPVGAFAPLPKEKVATTRSATTSGRSGPSTAPSLPGDSSATASRTKRPRSRRAFSTPPSASRGGFRKRSGVTRVA